MCVCVLPHASRQGAVPSKCLCDGTDMRPLAAWRSVNGSSLRSPAPSIPRSHDGPYGASPLSTHSLNCAVFLCLGGCVSNCAVSCLLLLLCLGGSVSNCAVFLCLGGSVSNCAVFLCLGGSASNCAVSLYLGGCVSNLCTLCVCVCVLPHTSRQGAVLANACVMVRTCGPWLHGEVLDG